MTSIRAKLLLNNLARQQYLAKRKFSVNEIEEKIKQIKYLTKSGEYSPDLIFNELNDLYHRTSFISQLEKELIKKKNNENNKIKLLKKENEKLRKKLALSKDKHFDKKVNQLSHLLGDYLAKNGSIKDVETTKAILKNLNPKKKKINLIKKPVSKKTQSKKEVKKEDGYYITDEDIIKLRIVYNRLKMLKHQLNIYRNREQSLKDVALYDKKIAIVEKKINEFSEKYLAGNSGAEIGKVDYDFKVGKHTIMFEDVLKSEEKKLENIKRDLDHELPLPPPPGFKR
jgi:protease II